MDIKKYCRKIKSVPLFDGMADEILETALADSELCEFSAGEEIGSSGYLAYVDTGCVNVYSADDRRRLLLRRIRAGEIFGAAGLFSETGAVSRVYSKGASRILLFGADTVKYMLENDSVFMLGYISFLSGRISYLNNKIKYLTGGTAERKLALFINSFESESVNLPVNLTSVSDMLDIGRASLYRALDRLASDGCIARTGNSIIVLDRKGMLEKY